MRVLIADFDKTVYTDNYDKNIEAINKFVDDGNVFIIATGRNLYSLKKDLSDSLKYSYLVCNNGGIIFDKGLNVVYRKDITDEVAKSIFDILKKNPYVGNPLIDKSTRYEDDIVSHANAVIARIIDRNKTKELLDSIIKKYPQITGYLSDRWLNIDDQSVSKGSALKHICNFIDYDYKMAYAIGDNLNDISMCEICNGFIIKGGSLELEKVCKGIVSDVFELIELLMD